MSATEKSGHDERAPDRVMIYRLGSIGDTAVALPCFKFLRRRFPSSRLSLLTNHPRHGEAPVLSVIGPMGLVDKVLPYHVGERDPRELWRLMSRIRSERPDLVVYLSEYRGTAKLFRDVIFLRLAGAGRIVGTPFGKASRMPREIGPNGELEQEAARLARCLDRLGTIDLEDADGWNLDFTPEESQFARGMLDDMPGGGPFVTASVGAKIPSKDWGEPAWTAVLRELSSRLEGHGLVMIGGPDDRERSARVARVWDGPVVNLCGQATPRQSAAVMARAAVFVGTDGGPMHLAAAAGTRCCALFGPYNRPRQWHPLGPGHHITHVEDLQSVDPVQFAREAVDVVNSLTS